MKQGSPEETKRACYEAATLENISDSTGTRMDVIFMAMDKYACICEDALAKSSALHARSQAIAFAEWTGREGFTWCKGDYWKNWNRGAKLYTASELYDLFTQQK
jgi:hypothetical protein